MPGAQVTFTPIASGDTLSPAAAQTSSSAGVASATLASTVAGTQAISANISGAGFTAFALGPVNVTFTPGDPSASKTTLTATPVSPATVTADGMSTFTITLAVADVNGNRLANLSGVQITSDGVNNTLAPVTTGGTVSGSTISGTTDSSGNFVATLATTKAQGKNISAIIPKPLAGGTLSVSGLALTFVAGQASTTNTTLTVSPTKLTADGVTTTTMTLTPLDAFNNPTSISTSGQFASAYGLHDVLTIVNDSAAAGYTATIKSTQANANDGAKWCWESVDQSAGACPAVVIDFTPGPASTTTSTITPAASPLQSVTTDSPNNTVTISATFLDQYANPLSGTATVTVTGSTNTFPSTVALTSVGVASFTLSSTHAETKTITVTLGSFSLTTQVKFVPGQPVAGNSSFTLTPSGASPVHADGTQSYSATLTVRDAGGNLVNSAPAVALSVSGQHSYFSPATGNLLSVGTFFSTLTSYLAQTESVTATVGNLVLTVNGIVFAPSPWQQANGLYGGRVTGIAFDPNSTSAASEIVYASTLAGVMKSTNDGASWTLMNNGLETKRALAVGATSVSGLTVVLLLATSTNTTTSNTAYRSTNGGNSWTPVTLPGAASFIYSGKSGMFVVNNAASSDGGQTWTTATLSTGAAVSLVSVAAMGSTLIALNSASGGPEVVTSTNGGTVWNAANGGAVNCGGTPATIAVDGSTPPVVYYGCVNGFYLYQSTNSGASFSSVDLPSNSTLMLAADPYVPGLVVWANTYGQVFKTTYPSNSVPWTEILYEDYILATSIVFDPLNENNLWIGSNQGSLYAEFSYKGPDFAPGITVLTTSGSTATFDDSGMAGAPISEVQWVPASVTGTVATAYTYANGLYSSTDGINWTLVPAGALPPSRRKAAQSTVTPPSASVTAGSST